MTVPSSPPIRIGAGAHKGKVREENQDRISRFLSSFGEVFVVADGVGGYQGGAIAAEMVINGLEAHLRELPADTPPDQALKEAARRTSADVHRRAHSGDPATANMGATGVLALLAERQARVGHAGDCRAYLLRAGELARLTRDHSRIQQMLEHNLLSEEEAREHPDASIVTRAFGKEADLDLEVSAPFELFDGDLLLLSSDGLCGYVDDAAIGAALRAGGDAQEIADRLIGLALDAGGEDNVSVQVIVLGNAAAAPAPLAFPAPGRPSSPGGRLALSWKAIAVLLVLAFLAGLLIPWDRLRDAVRKSWRRDGTPAGPEQVTPGSTRKDDEETAPDRGDERRPRVEETAPPEPVEPDAGTPDLNDQSPQPVPEERAEVRVYILGDRTGGELRRLLSSFAPEWGPGRGEKPDGFPRGGVFFREKHRQAAEDLLQDLNRKIGPDGRVYSLKPWPKDLANRWPNVEILVVPWREDKIDDKEEEKKNPGKRPPEPEASPTPSPESSGDGTEEP